MPRNSQKSYLSNTEIVPVSLDKLERAWDELMRPVINHPATEGWLTAEQFAEKQKMSNSGARARLNQLTKEGRLEKIQMVYNGRTTGFYRPKVAQ
jgi:predicted ArsR family transcriptional regulator